MTRQYFVLALVIELLGLGLVGAGIGYEAATGAHWGYVMITCGSWLVATGGVIFGKFLKFPGRKR